MFGLNWGSWLQKKKSFVTASVLLRVGPWQQKHNAAFQCCCKTALGLTKSHSACGSSIPCSSAGPKRKPLILRKDFVLFMCGSRKCCGSASALLSFSSCDVRYHLMPKHILQPDPFLSSSCASRYVGTVGFAEKASFRSCALRAEASCHPVALLYFSEASLLFHCLRDSTKCLVFNTAKISYWNLRVTIFLFLKGHMLLLTEWTLSIDKTPNACYSLSRC